MGNGLTQSASLPLEFQLVGQGELELSRGREVEQMSRGRWEQHAGSSE